MPAETVCDPRRVPTKPPTPINPKPIFIKTRRHRYPAPEHPVAAGMEHEATPMTEAPAYEHFSRPGCMQAKRDLARCGAAEPEEHEGTRQRTPSTPVLPIRSCHVSTITTLPAPPKS